MSAGWRSSRTWFTMSASWGAPDTSEARRRSVSFEASGWRMIRSSTKWSSVDRLTASSSAPVGETSRKRRMSSNGRSVKVSRAAAPISGSSSVMTASSARIRSSLSSGSSPRAAKRRRSRGESGDRTIAMRS